MTLTIEEIKEGVIAGNELNLSSLEIEDTDIELISKFLYEHPAINKVNLSNNYISTTGAKKISDIKSILTLNLAGNPCVATVPPGTNNFSFFGSAGSQAGIVSTSTPKRPAKKELQCLTNKDMNFTILDGSKCVHQDKEYFYSSNNQLGNSGSSNSLLKAEYAVFSGNLMKLILGEHQPDYYLAKFPSREKYYRICNELNDYRDWEEVIQVDNSGDGTLSLIWDKDHEEEDIHDLNIQNLTAILVACHFLGEMDWAEGNFGFVKKDDGYIAVRLDPGFSFNDIMLDNKYKDLPRRLDNLLLSYISAEINSASEDRYLCNLIDHEKGIVINAAADTIFRRKDEILRTLRRISEISKGDLHEVARRSFSNSEKSQSHAEILIDKLLKRQSLYKRALRNLQSQPGYIEIEGTTHLQSGLPVPDHTEALCQSRKRKLTHPNPLATKPSDKIPTNKRVRSTPESTDENKPPTEKSKKGPLL